MFRSIDSRISCGELGIVTEPTHHPLAASQAVLAAGPSFLLTAFAAAETLGAEAATGAAS
jgi:hypothetical protein